MKRTLSLSALCLTALMAPSAAPAFPNSAERHVIAVNGVPYTVLQDHSDQLRWYYAPAAASLGEYGKQLPALALIKYQAANPSNKQQLQENGLLFVTLTLAPDAATLAALSKEVRALPAMESAKGDPRPVSFAALQLSEAKLSLFGADGALVAEAPSREGVNATPSVEQIQFAVQLPDFSQETYELLVNRAGGLKIAVDYKYMAAGQTAGKWVPAPAPGRAAGSLGLAAYTENVRSQSVMIVPPQGYEMAMLALPAVGQGLSVKNVKFTAMVLDPDGKPVRGMQAVAFQWTPAAAGENRAAGDTGWRDAKKNQVAFALFPAKALLEMAKAKAQSVQDYKFFSSVELQPLAGPMPKATVETPLFAGNAPVSLPSAYFNELQLSPAFLVFGDSANGEEIYMARFQVGCDKVTYAGKLTKDSLIPYGAYLPKGCAPKISLDNITKQGKVIHSLKGAMRDFPGSVLYLTNDGEYASDGPL